jgi:hypothetical protein
MALSPLRCVTLDGEVVVVTLDEGSRLVAAHTGSA